MNKMYREVSGVSSECVCESPSAPPSRSARSTHASTMRQVLIHNDQLGIERAKGNVFHGYAEGPLAFRLTYQSIITIYGRITLDSPPP